MSALDAVISVAKYVVQRYPELVEEEVVDRAEKQLFELREANEHLHKRLAVADRLVGAVEYRCNVISDSHLFYLVYEYRKTSKP